MKACVRFMIVAGLLLMLAPLPPRALAQSCTELISDGGFETGAAWQIGHDPVAPQYVTYTKHSGNRALALGIISGANVESYSSTRQLVTIPAAATQVTLSFWFYAMANSPATTDAMELVLLDATGAAIVAKPWYSHNDSRIWNQMSLDLTPWRGQTVQVYFNVYNDGLGGTAAMFLDDVSLTACTGAPAPTPTGAPTGTPAPTATLAPSATPGCADRLIDGAFSGGLGSWQMADDSAGAIADNSLYRSAPYALKLGSLDQNLNSLTTVRQLVTIPAGYAQVSLEAWVYTRTQPGAGADYQRIALQTSGGSLLSTLWPAQENNPAWHQLTFDLAGFAGQTVFVSFSVFNDGAGGRTVMYVDDVRLLTCTGGPAATATPTPTPTVTAASTPVGTPSATPTALPSGCIDLLQNRGFEAQFNNWYVPDNDLLPAVVAAPVHEGAYAVQLGSQTQNLRSYSSVRQTVTVPAERPRVYLQFWARTWAESLSGHDVQEAVILGPDEAVWFVPWKVLDNRDEWQPHTFPLIGVAGQTFSVYFNVINDGKGGRTAMWVDDVHLYACPTDATPAGLILSAASAATSEAPAATDTAGRRMTPHALTAERGATPGADWTRTAPLAPGETMIPARPITPAPASQSLAANPSAGFIASLAAGVRTLQQRILGAERVESVQAVRVLLSCVLVAAAIAVVAWLISRQKNP